MSKLFPTIIEYILINYVNFYFSFKNSPFSCFSRNNNNYNKTSIFISKKEYTEQINRRVFTNFCKLINL